MLPQVPEPLDAVEVDLSGPEVDTLNMGYQKAGCQPQDLICLIWKGSFGMAARVSKTSCFSNAASSS